MNAIINKKELKLFVWVLKLIFLEFFSVMDLEREWSKKKYSK